MTKNRQLIIAASIVLVLAATLTAVLLGTPTGHTVQEEKIIGAILPLSGSLSGIGEEIRNGMTLADEDLEGISIIYEDSRLEPATALLAYEKLMTIDRVDAVHVAGTPVIEAIKAQMPPVPLSITSVDPDMVEGDMLRVFYNAPEAIETLAQELEGKEVVVVHQHAPFFTKQADMLKAAGVDIKTVYAFEHPAKDFSTTLLKIGQDKDVAMLGYAPNIKLFCEQATKLGVHVHLYGGIDFADLQGAVPQACKDAVFVTPVFNAEETAFHHRYEERFGQRPTHQAAYAYDTIMLLNRKLAGEDITGTYEGVSGTITVHENGDTSTEVALATYKGERMNIPQVSPEGNS